MLVLWLVIYYYENWTVIGNIANRTSTLIRTFGIYDCDVANGLGPNQTQNLHVCEWLVMTRSDEEILTGSDDDIANSDGSNAQVYFNRVKGVDNATIHPNNVQLSLWEYMYKDSMFSLLCINLGMDNSLGSFFDV